MSIMRYRGPSVLDDFRREMNQLFNPEFNSDKSIAASDLQKNMWSPAVDIRETDKQFVLLADLPGMQNKDIDIFIDDNHRLVLKGERQSEEKSEKENYLRIERFSGSFYRAFGLPDNIDKDGITAKFKDGTLEVIIPKGSKNASRQIQIEG